MADESVVEEMRRRGGPDWRGTGGTSKMDSEIIAQQSAEKNPSQPEKDSVSQFQAAPRRSLIERLAKKLGFS